MKLFFQLSLTSILCCCSAFLAASSENGHFLTANAVSVSATGSSLTPMQKKVSGRLLKFVQTEAQGAAVFLSDSPAADFITNEQDIVYLKIEIRAEVTDELLAFLKENGAKEIKAHPRWKTISCQLPSTSLERVAEDARIKSIREMMRPILNKANTSEGVSAHLIDDAVRLYGATGEGVKIGVISDSVRYLSSIQLSGDLPDVTVLSGQDGVAQEDLGEGTAMLEIVHDVAPDAELYFATASPTEAQFADNILALHEAGCHIIVDDATYIAEPAFQDGIVAQAVNEVRSKGCLYFSSAANSGNKKMNESGTYEGDFVSGGEITHKGVTYDYHNFGGKSFTTLTKCNGGAHSISLQWADPYDQSLNDYALLVEEKTGERGLSDKYQGPDAENPPFERASCPGNGACIGVKIAVLKKKGAAPRYFRLDAHRGRLEHSTTGSTYGHNAAETAVTVGAASALNGDFSSSTKMESFSSDGPRRIFYHPDGTAITPGNFSSTGGKLLKKVDITAADRVSCKTPGFNPFAGTSAAAPHAAAIAALMLSVNPSLTQEEIVQIMGDTAWKINGHATPIDELSGRGIINAKAAVETAIETLERADMVVKQAPEVYIKGTTMTWTEPKGAKFYKIYRTTNPYADPVAITDWQTSRSYTITKPTAEGTAYFYFVKASSEQDDALASCFSSVKVAYKKDGNTSVTYPTDKTYVVKNDYTEFHLYDSDAFTDWPYSSTMGLMYPTKLRVTTSSGAGSGITVKVNDEDIATNPVFDESSAPNGFAFMRWSMSIKATANTSTTPRAFSFYTNGDVPPSLVSDPESYLKGSLGVMARPHYIYQAGATHVSVDSTAKSVASKGGDYTVAVTATPTTTEWTASTSSSWIKLYRESSTGSGDLGFCVDENTGATRTGTIVVSGASKSFTIRVTQRGYASAPPAPSIPSVAKSGTALKISWNTVVDATRYDLYRSTSTTRPSSAYKTNVTSPYTDSAVVAGMTYYYWVAAVNAYGTSYSSRVSGTTGGRPNLYFDAKSETSLGAVFLSRDSEYTTRDSSFTCGESIYLFCAFANNGESDINTEFLVRHEVLNHSGTVVATWNYDVDQTVAVGKALFWGGVRWNAMNNLDPGRYTYRCTLDAEGDIAEESESDNVYTYSFTITAGTPKLTVDANGTLTAVTLNGATSVTIPDTVTAIGASVFKDCAKLTSVTLHKGLKSIGDEAFSGCSALTSITIPEGVTSIGEAAFFKCTSLKSITIPEGVTTIKEHAFNCCSSLTSAAFPSTLTSIETWAFAECKKLTSISFSEGLLTIGNYAFTECISLASVTFPESLTSLGFFSFSDSSNLASVTFLGKPPTVDVLAFSDLNTKGYYSQKYCTEWEAVLDSARKWENLVFSTLLNVTPASVTVAAAAKVGTIALTANCSWTASSSATWLTLSPTSGSGSASVTYSVAKNTSTSARTATITISGGGVTRTITVTQQAGTAAKPNLAPASFTSWDHDYTLFTAHNTTEGSVEAARLFTADELFDLVVGIGNFGEGSVSATIAIRAKIISETTNAVVWTKTWDRTISLGTNKGVTSRISKLAWDNMTSDVYKMQIELDVDNAIEEEDETDNSTSFVFAIYDPISIAEALNCTNLTFTGDNWYGTRGETQAETCARTRHLENSTTNSLTTTVTGPGTLSFDWKVSSEKNYDKLSLVVDGETVKEISGTDVDWSEVSYELGSGSHTIEWRYTKDYLYSIGYDCAWLKDVTWTLDSSLVTFNANGGVLSGSSTRRVTTGSAIGTLPVPTRSGYTFLGWFTAATGGTQVSATTTVSRDMTLYAQWRASGPIFTITNGVLTAVALNGCTEVAIPNTVTSIGNYAFAECTQLTKVKFTSGLRQIGDFAFTCCNSLTSIEFPATLTSIGKFAFYDCPSLKTVTFLGKPPTTNGNVVFDSGVVGYYPTNYISEWCAVIDSTRNWKGATFEAELDVTINAITATESAKTGTFSIRTNCTWTATPSVTWVTVSPTEGAGNATVTYTVAANASSARTATITISAGGRTHTITVTQQAGSTAKPNLRPAYLTSWGHNYELFTAHNTTEGSLEVARLFTVDELFDLVVGIGNLGEGDVAATIAIRAEITSETTNAVVWTKTWDRTISLGTNIGTTSRISKLAWNNMTSDVYKIRVELDVDNDVEEEDETDNSTSFLFAIYDPIPIAEALNCTNLTFTGDNWYGTRGETQAETCARTRHLEGNTTNSLTTTVTGPGTLSFDWKVSSEKNYDKLSLVVDGETVKEISGIDVDWSEVSYELGSGSHTIEWRYTKDYSYSMGYDCAWLKDVTWTLDSSLVTFNANGGALSGSSTRRVTTGSAIGTLPVPTRSGYTFLGWFTSVTGGTQVYATTTVSRNMTLYAHWKENQSSDPIPELDDDATSADVATALKDAKDAKLLTHITTPDEYAAFRDWVTSLPSATPQEVKNANHAWLSYALDVDSLIATPPRQGDMTIAAFDGKPSADELAFTVDIKSLTVGDGATAENLKKVFAIEGCTSLDAGNFSSAAVSLKLTAVEDGKVKFTIAPKSTAAKTFFFRVKMNDVD